jgi:hypothetical protein
MEFGFRNTSLNAKRQKAADLSAAFVLIFSIVSESRNSTHGSLRSNDLCRVEASVFHAFNHSQVAGDCLSTRKYVADEILAGNFTGDAA